MNERILHTTPTDDDAGADAELEECVGQSYINHPATRITAVYRENATHRCESVDVVWEQSPPDTGAVLRVIGALFEAGRVESIRVVGDAAP